jgi:hypothetical protein
MSPGTFLFEILLSKVTAELQRRKISIYQDNDKNDTKFLLSFDHPSSSSLSSLNYINIILHTTIMTKRKHHTTYTLDLYPISSHKARGTIPSSPYMFHGTNPHLHPCTL